MAVIIGADGYKGGWLSLSLDTATGQIVARVARTADFPLLGFDVLAIDIPIGLPEAGSREAEPLARKYLGPKRLSSVFPPPITPALHCSTRVEASEVTQAIDGRRVSAQGFALFTKIREVRGLLQANPQLAERTYEIHPEVSFAEWAGEPMVHSKKTIEGKRERQTLIASHFGPLAFERIRRESKDSLPEIDLADAFAALWSARRILEGTAATFPVHRTFDSAGFPLNIWY